MSSLTACCYFWQKECVKVYEIKQRVLKSNYPCYLRRTLEEWASLTYHENALKTMTSHILLERKPFKLCNQIQRWQDFILSAFCPSETKWPGQFCYIQSGWVGQSYGCKQIFGYIHPLGDIITHVQQYSEGHRHMHTLQEILPFSRGLENS